LPGGAISTKSFVVMVYVAIPVTCPAKVDLCTAGEYYLAYAAFAGHQTALP
jgi:hypothetical protein